MSGLTFKIRLLIQVCSFKLLGFKKVQQRTFIETGSFKKNGEIVAKIKYNDYYIKAHMPQMKIVQVNETLMADRENSILQQPKGRG